MPRTGRARSRRSIQGRTAIPAELSNEAATDALREDRVEEFLDRLRRTGRNRLTLATLWRTFAAVWPRHPQGVEGRRWLLAVLDALSERGELRLPAARGKRWDRTSSVPLPASIDLIRPERTDREQAWRRFPWHPSLQWVLELPKLSPQQERFLYAVHRGLTEGWFQSPAPLKYRSLQLTGDEKALQHLAGSRLFGPGRLTLQMLGCRADTTPIAWESTGPRPRMLILENTGSFLVARAALAKMSDPPYGMVAYGGGEHVLKGLGYLASIDRPIESLHYLGDLDRRGITIAAWLQRRAAAHGLSSVAPAPRLHAAMLRSAKALGAASGWPARSERASLSEEDLAFLPPEQRDPVRRMLAENRRIPEEVLDEAALLKVWATNRRNES